MEERRCITIEGAVQGVGFRPFVYRLATEAGLSGWVRNDSGGVVIEVEGASEKLSAFYDGLQAKKPPNAVIHDMHTAPLPLRRDRGFQIHESERSSDDVAASIQPDLAVCQDCLREMRDPADRRYLYPFTNCTNCGPRYTIMNALPYDRPHTSMAGFELCAPCHAEYKNPLNRRFHAQPIACPQCGPQLALWDNKGKVLKRSNDALQATVAALDKGKIVAIKGLGGFHFCVDAGNEEAVQKLRLRKQRKTRPFAMMYPSLTDVKKDCMVSEREESLLTAQAAPIVLLRHKSPERIASSVAPGNPYFGVMLPYTPLHHLLMDALQRPVIATSGNLSSEPIYIDEQQALETLSNVADLFLVHNRPILNRADDSIVRIVAGREMVLRRARGYAPMPLLMPQAVLEPVLAAGGHLKNTVALARKNLIFLSPHVGDLDTPQARAAHRKARETLCRFYRTEPEIVAHDAHPGYASTQEAQKRQGRTVSVQHHYAHALSCMADNGFDAPCFAVVWDGTGYGADGTIWGGEFLSITPDSYERTCHFLPFPLPGGEQAIREPRRAAFGLLYALQENAEHLPFSKEEHRILTAALEKKINSPLTSSVGRLFDAVASLTGLCHENSFEGEAAMALEFAAEGIEADKSYHFEIMGGIVDWRPMARNILDDISSGIPAGLVSARFHHTLAEIIVYAARDQTEKHMALTGGCFQNKLLLETTVQRLEHEGFSPFWHRQIPPNDGGIAVGQVMAALREKN